MSNRIRATTLALLIICKATVAHAYANCYAVNNIASPRITMQTIVLIDLTTPAPPGAADSLLNAAIAAAAKPGQRVVVLTFSGNSASEFVKAQFGDVVDAEISDPVLIERLPIRSFQRSQSCVKDAQQKWAAIVRPKIQNALPGLRAQPFQHSEIIGALRMAIRSFVEPGVTTRLFVWSDGLEHDSAGLSFYSERKPRKIDAQAELAKLPAYLLAPPAPLLGGELQVLWSGLLVGSAAGNSSPGGTVQYFDEQMVDELRRFWIGLLGRWGVQAREVQIERELLNPRLIEPQAAKAIGKAATPRMNLTANRSR